jgi:phthiocerol/phenolphthiocerol synthesis type-I polyketide synthase E
VSVDESDIAIVGMAGRFPGARNIDEFWRLLRDGTEAITFFSDEELLEQGVPQAILDRPRYVRAKGVVDDPDTFDASFFGYSPRDAAAIDPQQRLFLECAWEALENAGIDPRTAKAAVGVYAGSSASTYLTRPLRELGDEPEFMEIVLGNDKDFLPTRTSYKLDLKGPSVCVQTACSTSLVAVHVATQGLLSGDCGVALAGGVSVMFPQREGYTYSEDGIYSHDGHCRAFDANATGTLPGDGVGIVVLKLLSDALRDGDQVHAVIKGTAINNDGAAKVGFTAPSIAGQAAVISTAHRVAGVDASTIGYVEAHGTGTALGDPAEIAGLTKAFRAGTDKAGFCAIGSVKSNIGHLDVAAGIAGLIKTVLVLKHGVIPPSLHVGETNPAMRIETSPFRISTAATAWPAADTPRRAGVSSFGIGGTNAHVVLEEAPQRAETEAGEPALLLVSAKTESALDAATANLAAHLTGNSNLADVAYTTQVGRRSFEYRRFVVAQDAADATAQLSRRPRAVRRRHNPSVVFMFPGQGAQYVHMGTELYRTQPRFRMEIDRCREYVDIDLESPDMRQTANAQPALFAVEYALAKLWQHWGVRPRALIGHSLGEYVAACLAGVFTLKDALTLVARRGQLMQEADHGAMLSVALPERELVLPSDISLAAVNGPDLCVVSGPEAAIQAFQDELAGVPVKRLHTSHAFHSAMMTNAAKQLREFVADIPLRQPEIPFVSNVTGDWITPGQAADPDYWARHTLEPVRFADGLKTVTTEDCVLLEAGPGHTLSTLAKQYGTTVPSMRHPKSDVPDAVALAEAVGRLWAVGVPIDWNQRATAGRRVSIPTYPFERQRYRLDQPLPATTPATRQAPVVATSGSEVERAVAGIWAELLGVDVVVPEDDFFRLGGHSLLGTRLTSRLGEVFGVQVRLRDLFEVPTVAGQARLVDALRGSTRVRSAEAGYEEGEL